MEVICAQLSATANKTVNLQKAINAIKKAQEMGGDLILFPEMFMCFTSAEDGPLPVDVAETLDGEFVSGLTQNARKYGIYVVCGIYEQADNSNKVYNSVITINKNGEIISNYRKTHLCDSWNVNESDLFIPGKTPFEVIETEYGRIGLIICYELRFPEISRYLTLHNIDILLIPAAWYSGKYKEEHWRTLTQARAIENTIYVCAVNQPYEPFCGRSVILDPMGVPVSSAGEEEILIKGTVNLDRIQQVRKNNPCLNNRVQGLYS